jgi:hypothetical protein
MKARKSDSSDKSSAPSSHELDDTDAKMLVFHGVNANEGLL